MNPQQQSSSDGASDYAYSAASGAALTLTASHTWGIDVSGTAQGAGGVGGLLASTLHDGASSETFLPSYDGNGNISAWSDPGGAPLTRTDYSPFGQVVARYRLGPPGDTRPDRLAFGFSTKFTDAESGLLYYGYRYLDPVAGRWLSRDPIGENGGVNLYGFVGNTPTHQIDRLGLEISKCGIYFEVSECSAEKTQDIGMALCALKSRLAEARAKVRQAARSRNGDRAYNGSVDILNKWFANHQNGGNVHLDGNHYDQIDKVLEAIQLPLYNNKYSVDRIRLRCLCECEPNRLAYTWLPSVWVPISDKTKNRATTFVGGALPPIMLCPEAFTNKYDGLAETIAHELAHGTASLVDKGYYVDGMGREYTDGGYTIEKDFNDKIDNIKSPSTLLQNADTFAEFLFDNTENW